MALKAKRATNLRCFGTSDTGVLLTLWTVAPPFLALSPTRQGARWKSSLLHGRKVFQATAHAGHNARRAAVRRFPPFVADEHGQPPQKTPQLELGRGRDAPCGGGEGKLPPDCPFHRIGNHAGVSIILLPSVLLNCVPGRLDGRGRRLPISDTKNTNHMCYKLQSESGKKYRLIFGDVRTR